MTQGREPWYLPGSENPWPPWPGDLVKGGRHELFVRSVGDPDSPTGLFVHGLGGSSGNWTDVMGLLSDDVYARAVDLPGFGQSEPPRDFGYTLDEHSEAVVDLLSSFECGPVHLFGNSMGGVIAIRVAARHPELVRTLTLISPALPTVRPHGDNALVGILAVPGLGERLMSWLWRQPTEEVVSLLNRVVYDASRAPPQRVEAAVEELEYMKGRSWSEEALIKSTRGLISSYLIYGSRSLWRQAAYVQAPTL